MELESNDDNVHTDNNDKADETDKNYKLTKCRYLNKGCCKYRKKSRYTHPKEPFDKSLVSGSGYSRHKFRVPARPILMRKMFNFLLHYTPLEGG
jgi:hypothetical protein